MKSPKLKSYEDHFRESLDDRKTLTEDLSFNPSWAGPTAGKTWSPATNAPPYRVMSGDVGSTPDTVYHDKETERAMSRAGQAVPFPLDHVHDALIQAYAAIMIANDKIRACLSKNPTIFGAKVKELKRIKGGLEKQLKGIESASKELLKIVS